MIDHFLSDTHKNLCLEAIDRETEKYRIMLRSEKTITPTQAARMAAELPENNGLPSPVNGCFLCGFADIMAEEYILDDMLRKAAAGRYRAHLICDRFCPVIWDAEANPENKDRNRLTPCEQPGTHCYLEFDSRDKEILSELIDLLRATRKNVEQIPVKTKGNMP